MLTSVDSGLSNKATSAPQRKNLKRGSFTLKTHQKRFSVHTTSEEFELSKTQQSLVTLSLCLRKSLAGKSLIIIVTSSVSKSFSPSRTVFEKLRFRDGLVWTAGFKFLLRKLFRHLSIYFASMWWFFLNNFQYRETVWALVNYTLQLLTLNFTVTRRGRGAIQTSQSRLHQQSFRSKWYEQFSLKKNIFLYLSNLIQTRHDSKTVVSTHFLICLNLFALK